MAALSSDEEEMIVVQSTKEKGRNPKMKIVQVVKGKGFKVSRGYVTWDFPPTILTANVEIESKEDLEHVCRKLNSLLEEILKKDIEETKEKDSRFATALKMVDLDFEEHEEKVERKMVKIRRGKNH